MLKEIEKQYRKLLPFLFRKFVICARCGNIGYKKSSCSCGFGTYRAWWVFDSLFDFTRAYIRQILTGDKNENF